VQLSDAADGPEGRPDAPFICRSADPTACASDATGRVSVHTISRVLSLDISDVRAFPADQAFSCDVCIVGSGPAGLTLAGELSGNSLSVLILESGGRSADPWADAFNTIESVGAPRVPDQSTMRNRIFGGSSHTWSGRVAAFDAVDFAARAWVPHSGWPIPRAELARFLPRTRSYLGLALTDNVDPVARRAALGDGADRFDPALLEDYVWTYSRGESAGPRVLPADYMRFGTRARRGSFPNARCLVNATVVHIDTNPAGTAVTGLDVRGPDGLPRRVAARATILCGGGIENARLLLASDRIVRGGVGNACDRVGRYLMDHPRGVAASARPEDFLRLHTIFGSRRRTIDGRPAVVMQGAALSRTAQERDGLLNCAVWYNGVVDEADPYAAAIRLARGRGGGGDLAILAREAGFLANGAARLVARGRTPPRRYASLALLAMVEQVPDPDSRVTLGTAVDAFGVPVSRIDWRVHAVEKRSVLAATRAFLAESRRLGFPVPDPSPELLDPGSPLPFLDSAHPTGTTRMSADPRDGVVDADCAVHGVAGLFLAGSSTFPTSGHTNPTQTIVALAIRLADHLKARLAAATSDRTPSPAIASAPAGSGRDDAPAPAARAQDGPIRVLVTGGSGRIGSVVVAQLTARGYAVRALTSRMRPASDGVEWVTRDLRRADLDFTAEVAGCAAILHLGAEMQHVEDMPFVNGAATGALARAAEAAGLRFMAYASSVAVYGLSLARVCREDGPTVTAEREVPGETIAQPWMRAYARTKLLGERAIAEKARTVEYVIFRPTTVVSVADVAAAVRTGALTASLRGRRDAHHVAVEDVAEAFIWAMERALGRATPNPGIAIYNLSDETLDDPSFGGLRAEAAAHGIAGASTRPWPALIDRSIEYLRHSRGRRPRFPLPYQRFPADRLLRDGFRYRQGMRAVRDAAFAALLRAGPGESRSPGS
jgi:choline dehydrogenase-like flavoprotein/nucleoside-diphosphate-sugar epimerase